MKNKFVSAFASVATLVLMGSNSALASGNHSSGHMMQEGGSHGGSHMIKKIGIQANGTLNTINQEKRKVNITHGPISALGWPPMRMDFSVKKGVDLQSLKPGQKVRFSIIKSGEYDHIVTEISPAH